VKPGLPIYDETAWTITIVDESGGEFVEVQDGHGAKIRISSEEWPALELAIGNIVGQCRDYPEEAK
jgi:hypothetical protein